MNKELFRSSVRWVGLLLLAHLVAMLIFGLTVSQAVATMLMDIEDYSARAYRTIFIYDTVFLLIFTLVFSRIGASYYEYRKTLREAIKQENFSAFKFYKQTRLKEHLVKVGIFAAFQLPFTVFFACWGLDVVNITGFEQFYILEAGSYAMTGSWILGFLLSVAVFALIHLGLNFALILINKRTMERV